MNNKSIQVLRGSKDYDSTSTSSTELLKDGQPFYSKRTKKLYIGTLDDNGNEIPIKDLRETLIGLNLENVNFARSLQSISSDSAYPNIASQVDTLAIGKICTASNKRAIAIGNQVTSNGNTAITFGQVSTNSGNAALLTVYNNTIQPR